MGFVWVNRYECSACGAETTTAAAVGGGFDFPVCPDCSRTEARARQ